MSMTDPIADMLIRIRNAQMVGHAETVMPASRLKGAIAKVLKDEGYIEDFAIRDKGGPSGKDPGGKDSGGKKELVIALKYYAGRPVIERLERVSKPGLRVYKGRDDIPRVMNGLGVAILSTSRGVMTDRKARADGVGGEVLCIVA
jgi:small subunit ribosomal protein S8